jgi:NTE family protein
MCFAKSNRRAVQHVAPDIPEELRNSSDWQLLDRVGCDAAITIVQLIHRRAATGSVE